MVAEPPDLKRPYRISGRQGGAPRAEGYGGQNVLASYVHLHFGSNPEVARHLVESCRDYKELREGARGN